ncbi:MAG: FkbM family methyltransferase [Candidatus Obscuribacterales bacterium]|nr:FkbM family methyltransferase [Candidatus Obscuribacterales bacterium]
MQKNHRPLLMRLLPPSIRERVFWRTYFHSREPFEELFASAPLEFAPGIKMKLCRTDVSHRMIAFTGFYESRISRLIRGFDQGTMIDVGANYGYYSLLWAGANPQNKVFAFEPVQENLKAIEENVQKNGLEKQIVLNNCALSNKPGVSFFDLGKDGHTIWGRLADQAGEKRIEVQVDTLDNLFFDGTFEKIEVLKIDTEGADFLIIRGADKLLKAGRIKHLIYEEDNPEKLATYGVNPGDAQNFLRTLGYEVRQITRGNFHAWLPE